MVSTSAHPDFVSVRGVRTEVRREGHGRALVFLHPGIGLFGSNQFLARLAEQFQVFAPSHPGFGQSDLPDTITTVDDFAYFYLDLFDQLNIRNAVVVGSSLGGWLGASIAVKSLERIGCLVLIDALGIKINGREERDIADIYGLAKADLDRRFYFDISKKVDLAALSDEDLRIVAKNRESEALVGWAPYMHDPKLLSRLHRIWKPTLVLWGRNDGIVSMEYGRALAAAIGNASFSVVGDAGHYAYIEQPDRCADRIVEFANNKPPSTAIA